MNKSDNVRQKGEQKGRRQISTWKTGGRLPPEVDKSLPAGEIKNATLFSEVFGTHGYVINKKDKLTIK